MDQFKGKTAIVTGGASGMGRALCEELGGIGAIVTVADLDLEGAKKVANSIDKDGGQACAEQLNVAIADEVKRVIEGTYSAHGRIDYIFNFAGILIVGEAFDMNVDDWSRIFDVNLKGVARNQKIIIFPFYARLFWYLYRIHPILASPLVGGLIKNFRALKSET